MPGKGKHVYAGSALLLLLTFVLAYAAAQYVFAIKSEVTSGLLGWNSSVIRIFNLKVFCTGFTILITPLVVYQLWIRKSLGGLTLIWFLAGIGLSWSICSTYYSIESGNGFLGFNETEEIAFNMLDFVLLFAAILSSYLFLLGVGRAWLGRGQVKSNFLLYRLGLSFLICLSFYLYLIGLHMTLFTSTKFWVIKDDISLIDSVFVFFNSGERFLGLLIIVFTICFPLVKFASAFWGLYAYPDKTALKVNYWLSHFGKWSMIDVFIVALIILSFSTDSKMIDFEMKSGVLVFAVSILLTMIVSFSLEYFVKKEREQMEGFNADHKAQSHPC